MTEYDRGKTVSTDTGNWEEHVEADHEMIRELHEHNGRLEAQVEVSKAAIEAYKTALASRPVDGLRRFQVYRSKDVTGLSGTGIVADGIEFPDGTCAVRWREVTGEHYDRGVRATTVIFANATAVEALHGHNGATVLVWLDN
jgi:hypothetical protein